MRSKKILLAAILCLLGTGLFATQPNFKGLNAQAAKEYQKPIRPFTDGRNPCWNEFCNRFIYAPVFDFQAKQGAVKYVYTIVRDIAEIEAEIRGDDDSEAQQAKKAEIVKLGSEKWSFTGKTPSECLAPIWKKIPVGKVVLTVEAFDKDGHTLGLCEVSQGKKGIVTERTFMRDFPFEGPYTENIRPYREAALMGMLYIHTMPQIQAWKNSTKPDMSYKHNTYANKTIGRTVEIEAKLAKYYPQYAEEALQIAKNAAQFLIDESRPEGDVLAFFPPTYYGDLIASKKSWNKGKMIPMDACYVANGFLDLYDACGDKKYYDQALKIADTFVKLQRPDGSMPIKCFYETGEPVNDVGAMLGPVLNFARRLNLQYGLTEYEAMRIKGEEWMNKVALETFNITGQFEDVNVEGLKPYANLTQCTGCPYASYLLKGHPSPKNVEDARDLIRMGEDQFVHWNSLPEKNGIRRLPGPCVFEQLHYQTPVDNSSCNVANAYLDLYEATGDKLAFAKAKALIDELTVCQFPTNGMTPTTLDYRNPQKDKGRTFWLNCSVATIEIWLRMADIIGE